MTQNSQKHKINHNFLIWHKTKKVRPLYFLQFSKTKTMRCVSTNLKSSGRAMAPLSFLAIIRRCFCHFLLVDLNDDRLKKEKQFWKS